MKINIYYGGRGLVDDPTIFVLDKMQTVLQELNVQVERFNLYEMKNAVTTLPQTLKSADGIIMATTVEWHGIGGLLASFLDAIWLYGDREKISQIYMSPIVMSTTYGEREAKLDLANAWEILGGLPCSGICGYIKDTKELQNNPAYITLIEKKAENLYRTVHQKVKSLPASNQAINQTVAINNRMDLTPQETEQLSQYAADEGYVQKQKEDIAQLASLFKGMLSNNAPKESKEYGKTFETIFHAITDVKIVFTFKLEDVSQVLQVCVNGNEISYSEKEEKPTDIELSMKEEVLAEIIGGRMTFQKAFMTGVIKMKGDFSKFRRIDELFPFS